MKKFIAIIILSLIFIIPVPVYAATPTYNLFSTKKITITEHEVAKLTLPAKYKNVTWKSSSTKVASVNKKGDLTAKAPGKATVTATSGTTKFSCTVYVNEDYSEWVLYSTDNLILLVQNIIDGDVVFMNDRYYCSPEYFNMLYEAQIAFEQDISENEDLIPLRDIILTPDAKFTFVEDDEEEKAAEEAALKIRMALMMKYGFATSAAMDTEIGKAYMKFCDEWISEYELKNSYGTSVVWDWPDNEICIIMDPVNLDKYIIKNAPDKFESGKIYEDNGVQYQYLEVFEYGDDTYKVNKFYFNREDLISKGIIK